MKLVVLPCLALVLFSACQPHKENSQEARKKDRIFLMGLGMLRLNWTKVRGDEIRFRYSDLGLPADFSTRERASFMVDGTFGHGQFTLDGHLNYDPENRITEPPLDFLLTASGRGHYASLGDYTMGVYSDSIFSRFYHPFRGLIVGTRQKNFGVEVVAGLGRGEAGIDQLAADSGVGPYYLKDSPILRGSETVFLVVRSASNPDLELSRTQLQRSRDYFVDYDRGILIFNTPLYPQDAFGNPVFILVSYQFESLTGRFTRDVGGVRALFSPWPFMQCRASYLADADNSLSLEQAFRSRRGIYAFGVSIDSRPLTFFGEFSFSAESNARAQHGFFGGGTVKITPKLHFYFNSWSLDTAFPVFANDQLQYGYSLSQVFPAYAQRNIFLSPFQFTRNLGAELYPFSLARISLDETEGHAFAEWEAGRTVLSGGWGERKLISGDLRSRLYYLSTFHNGQRTKAWGKLELDQDFDKLRQVKDAKQKEILLGARQLLWRTAKGELHLQADYQGGFSADRLVDQSATRQHTLSLFAEFLTAGEGLFAGYRKEILDGDEGKLLDADVFETGIRKHVWRGFFVDSRFRSEQGKWAAEERNNRIVSLGGGFEGTRFRLLARYEFQLNRSGDQEGRRQLWSLFLFGSPLRDLSINLNYYRQAGQSGVPLSLSENSEEQLNFRLLWRISRLLSLYSQWRYDSNMELYQPLTGIRSNSLASIQGLKLQFTPKWEFLANYKLLKIWGPIENRKVSAAAELGYLVWRHMRLGVGGELIDYKDRNQPDGNYHSLVGYAKLAALF